LLAATLSILKSEVSAKTPKKERVDFFISYNIADLAWAEWIAWQLEETGYSTIIQNWDFRPGDNFILEMQRAIETAKQVIAVLSDNYMKAYYTQSEWAAILAKDPIGYKRSLLIVRIQECNVTGMFQPIVRIDLFKKGLNELDAKKTLIDGVKPGRVKPSIPPKFPPGNNKRSIRKEPRFPKETSAHHITKFKIEKPNRKTISSGIRHRLIIPMGATVACLFLLSIALGISPHFEKLFTKTGNDFNDNETQVAGHITFPAEGATVASVGTVRASIKLKNTYAAVIIRTIEGSYWVQNDGITITSSAEHQIQVNYGGKGHYQIFLGVTRDSDLFKEGGLFTQLPIQDRQGHSVIWIGPVNVTNI
jgi:hypothetical protein